MEIVLGLILILMLLVWMDKLRPYIAAWAKRVRSREEDRKTDVLNATQPNLDQSKKGEKSNAPD